MVITTPALVVTPVVITTPALIVTPVAVTTPALVVTPAVTTKPTAKPTTIKDNKVPSKTIAIKPIPKYSSSLKKLKIVSSKKNTYKIYTKKNIRLTVSAKFGSSGKKGIYYQIVKKGKKYNKNKGWKKVSGKTIKITKNIKNAVVYIKYVSKAGKTTIQKTKGFTLDKKKPVVTGVVQNRIYHTSVLLKFSDSISGIKKATLNGKAIQNNYWVGVSAKYTLVVTDKAGNKTTVNFEIKKDTVQNINLSQSSIRLDKGKSTQLKATITPTLAKNKEVTWVSLNPKVATVKNGKVTAKAKGYAIIVAIAKANNKIRATCTVCVK